MHWARIVSIQAQPLNPCSRFSVAPVAPASGWIGCPSSCERRAKWPGKLGKGVRSHTKKRCGKRVRGPHPTCFSNRPLVLPEGWAWWLAVPVGADSGIDSRFGSRFGCRLGVASAAGFTVAHGPGFKLVIGGRVPRITPTRRTGGAESVALVA